MIYYNEIDKNNIEWLKELIADGLIPPGEIDERSITDVTGQDLKGFTQCHFFAGVGGWARALYLSGWPANRPVWTGSCPCQPVSVVGTQSGHEDERHLWPEFARLICEREPATIFGEQTTSDLGREWLAGIRLDLEAMGYEVGATDLCAACIGSPTIRQRVYWLADRRKQGLEGHSRNVGNGNQPGWVGTGEARPATEGGAPCWEPCEMCEEYLCNLHGEHAADCSCPGVDWWAERELWPYESTVDEYLRTVGNVWLDSVGWVCRDGKTRRVPGGGYQRINIEPEIFSVADGISERMDGCVFEGDCEAFPVAPAFAGRKALLVGYGNAIVPALAAEFIRAYILLDR